MDIWRPAASKTNGTYGAPDDDPNEMKHRNVKTQYSSFHSTKASFSFQKIHIISVTSNLRTHT